MLHYKISNKIHLVYGKAKINNSIKVWLRSRSSKKVLREKIIARQQQEERQLFFDNIFNSLKGHGGC